jgi:hypothetical protein
MPADPSAAVIGLVLRLNRSDRRRCSADCLRAGAPDRFRALTPPRIFFSGSLSYCAGIAAHSIFAHVPQQRSFILTWSDSRRTVWLRKAGHFGRSAFV